MRKVCADRIGEIMGIDENPGEAAFAEQPEPIIDQRPAVDRHKALWNCPVTGRNRVPRPAASSNTLNSISSKPVFLQLHLDAQIV